MDSIPYYFSHARTAFKFGIQHLGIKKGDCILIPDYICDVILHPLNQLGIEYKYYSLEDDLSFNCDQLENLLDTKIKALLFVHYFGQPQNIKSLQNFCKNHDLFLIEDNSHGYGGAYSGKDLGTFGDIGISSPRKLLTSTYSGGVLWTKNKELNTQIRIPEFPILKIERIKKKLTNSYPLLKNKVKKVLKKRPLYEDPRAFREPIISDYNIDIWSKKIIIKNNWDDMRNKRILYYNEREKFALKNGLKPVFSKLHFEANPWCFPAYANNKVEAVKWFKWGWENNQRVFSWPSLPEEIINLKGSALDRYDRLLCFSLDDN